ncbi:MAG: ABC transporter substrate-binding protein [Archaeoglobaceae archaeon]
MKTWVWVLLILSISAGLLGCLQPTAPEEKPEITTPVVTTPTTTPAEVKTPEVTTTPPPTTTPETKPVEFGGIINIGYTGPLSGVAAPYGESVLAGLSFAAEDINEAGGIIVGDKVYKLKVIGLDDMYMPSISAQNAQKLFKEKNTPIVFCPHAGGILEIEKINEKLGFIVGAYTSDPSVIKTGNKMVIMYPPNFELIYVPFFSDYFLFKGMKKAAMLNGTHEYAVTWGKAFKEYWTLKGGEIVAEEPVNYYMPTDYTQIVAKVLAKKPDVILLVGPSKPLASVIKIARGMGYTGGFIIAEQAKIEELMYYLDIVYDFTNETVVKGNMSLLDNVVATTSPCSLPLTPIASVDPNTPGYAEACKRLSKRLGDTPVTWEHVLSYQAMFVLAKAMEKAGSTDPQKIIDALEKETFPADGYKGFPKFIYSAFMRIYPYGTIGAFNTPGNAMICEGGVITATPGITPKFWGQEYAYTDWEGKVIWG